MSEVTKYEQIRKLQIRNTEVMTNILYFKTFFTYKSVPLYTTTFTLAKYLKKQSPLEVDDKITAYSLNYIAYIKDKWHSHFPKKIIIITIQT